MATVRPGLEGGRLSRGAREVLRAVSLGVLDGSLPPASDRRDAELRAQIDRLEQYIGGLPPAVRAELSQLLAILASPAGRVTFAGLEAPWGEASVEQVQASLESMRHSRLLLRRQAYQALRDLTAGSYFSQPIAWGVMGYPGPTDL